VLNVPADEEPFTLLFLRDGEVVSSGPVAVPTSAHVLVATRPGRYRLQLQRGEEIHALTSPVYLKAPGR
jgi:hypothetical protein